jgi:hypothetical protein
MPFSTSFGKLRAAVLRLKALRHLHCCPIAVSAAEAARSCHDDAAEVAEKIAAAAGGRRTAALIDSVAARLFPRFSGR